MKYCFTFLLVTLFACAYEPKRVTNNTTIKNGVDVTTAKQVADTVAELQVEAFDVPESLSGCTGLYARDTVNLQKEKYTFATDLQQTAFIKINGQLQQLQLQQKQSGKAATNATYTAGNIIVVLKAERHQKLGDELWLYKGTVTITKGNQQITLPVLGLVGC